MRKIFILLSFFAAAFIFNACEKDETKATLPDNPILPTLKTIPDLTFQWENRTNTLTFIGTAFDPSFPASISYYLEACAKGTNFASPVSLISDSQDTCMKITVSDLNGKLLKKFPADQVSEVDFRIRAVLNGSNGLAFSSATTTVNVALYGLPRLDAIVNNAVVGKIESPLGDGKYSGYIKLAQTDVFTLKIPKENIVLGSGGAANKLAVNGSGINALIDGWHKVVADTSALSYSVEAFSLGVVGSGTPTGWGTLPDTKMEYNAATGSFEVKMDLINGEIKFRTNNSWTWNLGAVEGKPGELSQGGVNIKVTAGNYTISVTIVGDKGTYTLVKN